MQKVTRQNALISGNEEKLFINQKDIIKMSMLQFIL